MFEGSIPEAKRLVPRRVHIDTEDDVGPLRQLAEVVSLTQMPQNNHPNGAPKPASPGSASIPPALSGNGHVEPNRWEIELCEQADPQAILQTCFSRGIRLRSFNQSEPTLHDVFVHLVGPEAREASHR